uniref:Uncharacterized protein n=1 Tax=Klebsiella pneumoniae TaxID=573 RepID=A0A6G9HQ16_KLEPN|nr:hypothetical protein [Klebsiella pneumoniae]QIQ12488.1 hypothetical protein [Klebsiella pneumoniae]QIQ12899.1 hypothetical protein [Klebsiella pneumoniae]UFD95777.1 hypothetical protein [Escherichia coli]UFD96946.1 hypothetical protein [Klebsiella pneumoniae]
MNKTKGCLIANFATVPLWSGEFFTVNGLPTMILTMNMERVLTQIDTNKRNVFHDGSPNESLSSA